jgi:hypothetical protein
VPLCHKKCGGGEKERREERRRSAEKGKGEMGEGRAARNGWDGSSGSNMCGAAQLQRA